VSRRLIIRPGAIGDTIVSLPALEHLRANYTEIWVPSPNLPLVAHLGRACSIASSGLDLMTWPPALSDRLRGFDEIVSWYGAGNDDFRERVSALGLPFQFHRALPPPDNNIHAVDFYLEQVGGAPGAIPHLPFERRDEGFAVIHPFSGSRRKNWPMERFREVGALLSATLPVFWCAGPEEPLNDAVRFEDLGALASWLARASILVSNDSGIAHLAAACGVPVLTLFGPTNPRVWAPRGPRTAILPFEATPGEVTSRAESLLR
jgi:heptosyltransferase III